MLTFAALNRHWPTAPHSLVEGIAASAPAVFAKYGLDTATAQADFLAQVSEETGAGTEVEENLNYTAERLVQVWPSRFPALATSASACAAMISACRRRAICAQSAPVGGYRLWRSNGQRCWIG